MISSEITEEHDEENPYFINSEAQKESIRRIIQHQKSLCWSSSSSSSITSNAAASSSSISSSRRSSSLLELMKSGSTSLKRLFEMEHTSLLTHFQDYSGSPIVKSVPLWGSDTDGEVEDPWASIKPIGSLDRFETGSLSGSVSDGSSMGKDSRFNNRKTRNSNRRLSRKKSYRKLPGFRFRLRLRRLRIMICGRLI
ncbi:hypothetical protein GOBAR_AA06533 [Gossypium barbadense]|uniref:Uncharacterized protein n=1 Tax=Gossypium barbadense TaxID=3634 RepID=A0A2P5YER1_GOSBA|nr:hypothetical protein GOBAR_AA06533 [Gossypium barbadense]